MPLSPPHFMSLRGVQRSISNHRDVRIKVTPAREWQQPEQRFRPKNTEVDDGLSSLGRVACNTFISIAALLTASPQHSNGELKDPSDRHHS